MKPLKIAGVFGLISFVTLFVSFEFGRIKNGVSAEGYGGLGISLMEMSLVIGWCTASIMNKILMVQNKSSTDLSGITLILFACLCFLPVTFMSVIQPSQWKTLAEEIGATSITLILVSDMVGFYFGFARWTQEQEKKDPA